MKCVICGAKKTKNKYAGLGIKECMKCGHIFFVIDEERFEPAKVYNRNYFVNNQYGNYLKDEPIIRLNLNGRKKDVLKYAKNGALLEIGSAYGFFLDMMKDDFKCVGFEASQEACSYGREKLGVDIRNEDFLKAKIGQDFDAVCMFDTIEHLVRPDLFISKASGFVRKGGHIFITTGDIGSMLARLQGKKWRIIHPPLHIHYFSKKSITSLLEKNGLMVVKIVYVPVWRSLHQMLSAIFRFRAVDSMLPLGIPLQTFDIMSVIAVKK